MQFVIIFLKLVARIFVLCIVFPLLKCLSFFRPIKIGHLVHERIGHLALNTENFLRTMANKNDRTIYILLAGKAISNHQLLKMYQRIAHVWISPFWSRIYHYTSPILSKSQFYCDMSIVEQDCYALSEFPPLLSFTLEEEAYGKRELLKMGIGEQDWFICFHSRDPAYLNDFKHASRRDFSYHDHRDSSILSYLPGAHYITEQGGFAIRMGAVVDAPLIIDNPKIIDYATKHRTDFMDVYLSAKCKFFLGNTSGIFLVSTIFNRPSACAHYVPFTIAPFFYQDLYIPKLLRDKASGQLLPMTELKRRGLLSTFHDKSDFEDKGVEFVDSEANDILALCQEMLLELKRQEFKASTAQALYKQKIIKPVTPPSHRLDLAGRVADSFLNKYRELFDLEKL